MSYNKNTWINDETELSAENMNHIESGIEEAYGQLLLAVDSEAPEECTTGDRYYNTETNKIYTATGTNTWGTTGVNAELGVFYIILETQNIYTYDGTTLVSVGGGAGGEALPVGTEVDFDGTSADIPIGWEQVDSYSTSEVKTGDTWIDGKPIYRKVLTGNTPSTSNTLLYSATNIEEIVNSYGWVQTQSSTTKKISVNSYSNDGEYNNISLTVGTGIYFNGSYVLGKPYKIVIEYTKSS